MSSNVSKCHQMSSKNFSKFFFLFFYIKSFVTFKFLNRANFFLTLTLNFLTSDLKSTIKSSSIKGGQIPKNVMLISSKSPIKTQETIFEVDIPAGVQKILSPQGLRTEKLNDLLSKSLPRCKQQHRAGRLLR